MTGNLTEAIKRFPVVRWLERQAKVYDSGGTNVYVDCPVCGGKKKLGVHRQKKTSQCFKCNEGGAHGTTWKGTAGLLKLIQVFEGCGRRQAIDRVYELSGVQDIGYTPKSVPESKLPPDTLPLTKCSFSHPAVQLLFTRGCSHLIKHSHVCLSGRYSHRVLMPIQWFGELRGYDAKAYLPGMRPKSLFAEWMDMAHTFHATHSWDELQDFCVITESVLDAETLGVNSLGMNGSTLRDGQLTRLLELRDRGIERLVWFLDWDAFKKQRNAILRKTASFFDNYVVPLTADTDPNELGREACWELVSQSIPVRDSFDLLRAEMSLRSRTST